MDDNLFYYVGFSHFLGIGPVRFDKLLNHFGNVRAAYTASLHDLQSVLGISIGLKFVQFRNKFYLKKTVQHITEQGITIINREDNRFPQQLREISDPPICLYVKGDISQFNFLQDYFIAIVGTRLPTAYGEQVARKFATELSQAGFVIVSGMATGIDAIAHQSALDNKARTIAFLGGGVDNIYPRSNTQLYKDIIQSKGLVISEFPPGMITMPGLFVARNRLISGLSRGVLVAEGLKDSGSLITARCALEQGREVFAPPAPITSQQSEAPNLLLKEGAKIVTSVQDILEEFNLKILPKQRANFHKSLSSSEKIIVDMLLKQSYRADELAVSSNLSIHQLLSLLSTLELRGIIEQNKEGRYQMKV